MEHGLFMKISTGQILFITSNISVWTTRDPSVRFTLRPNMTKIGLKFFEVFSENEIYSHILNPDFRPKSEHAVLPLSTCFLHKIFVEQVTSVYPVFDRVRQADEFLRKIMHQTSEKAGYSSAMICMVP